MGVGKEFLTVHHLYTRLCTIRIMESPRLRIAFLETIGERCFQIKGVDKCKFRIGIGFDVH